MMEVIHSNLAKEVRGVLNMKSTLVQFRLRIFLHLLLCRCLGGPSYRPKNGTFAHTLRQTQCTQPLSSPSPPPKFEYLPKLVLNLPNKNVNLVSIIYLSIYLCIAFFSYFYFSFGSILTSFARVTVPRFAVARIERKSKVK